MTEAVTFIHSELTSAIEAKKVVLDSLDRRRIEVKLEIQDAVRALESALKTREQWLLSHVDLIATSRQSSVIGQMCLLHEMRGRSAVDPLGDSEVLSLEEMSKTLPSWDLSFVGDVKEIRNALLNFGRIDSYTKAPENGSSDIQDPEVDQLSKFSELNEISENSAILDRKPGEDSNDGMRCSFKFDFGKGTFVRTNGDEEEEEASSKDETASCQIPPASDSGAADFPPSFRFNFSENKFIQTTGKDERKESDGFSLVQKVKSSEPTFDASSSVQTSPRPKSFAFSFSSGKFIPVVESSRTFEFNQFGSQMEEEEAFSKDETTSCQIPPASESRAVDFPPSFRFNFSKNKFIQTTGKDKGKENDRFSLLKKIKSSEPTFDASSSGQTSLRPKSFVFSFSYGKFIPVVESSRTCESDQSGSQMEHTTLSDAVTESRLFKSIQGVVVDELMEDLKCKEIPLDKLDLSSLKSFVLEIKDKIESLKVANKHQGACQPRELPGSFRFDFKVGKFLQINEDDKAGCTESGALPQDQVEGDEGGKLFGAVQNVIDLEIKKELEVEMSLRKDAFFNSRIRNFVGKIKKEIKAIADKITVSTENLGSFSFDFKERMFFQSVRKGGYQANKPDSKSLSSAQEDIERGSSVDDEDSLMEYVVLSTHDQGSESQLTGATRERLPSDISLPSNVSSYKEDVARWLQWSDERRSRK